VPLPFSVMEFARSDPAARETLHPSVRPPFGRGTPECARQSSPGLNRPLCVGFYQKRRSDHTPPGVPKAVFYRKQHFLLLWRIYPCRNLNVIRGTCSRGTGRFAGIIRISAESGRVETGERPCPISVVKLGMNAPGPASVGMARPHPLQFPPWPPSMFKTSPRCRWRSR